jgi:hypothetical protein
VGAPLGFFQAARQLDDEALAGGASHRKANVTHGQPDLNPAVARIWRKFWL